MKKTIAILLPNLTGGGAEKISVNLANELASRGYIVHMVLFKAKGEFLQSLNENIKVIDLKSEKLLSGFFPLSRYLAREKPDALLACMWPVTVYAILAKIFSRSKTRVVVAEHVAWTNDINSYSAIHKVLVPVSMKLFFPFAGNIVVVSDDGGNDLEKFSGLKRNKITTVYNPVVDADSVKTNYEPNDLEAIWAESKYRILTVGSFKDQKNHTLLIRAFSQLRESIDAHLLILGDGLLRTEMEVLIKNLGIEKFVTMPGFKDNTGSYYAHADLFALSSNFEGLPTVLIEALDAGTPIVSTNCPTGPREILEDGKFGILTPVGDAEALANAMLESLSKPHDKAMLKLRAQDFSISKATDKYLSLLLANHKDVIN